MMRWLPLLAAAGALAQIAFRSAQALFTVGIATRAMLLATSMSASARQPHGWGELYKRVLRLTPCPHTTHGPWHTSHLDSVLQARRAAHAIHAPAEGAAQPVTIDLSNLTSFGVTTVSSITQDGFPAGELTGFAFDRSGIAYASYSNNEVRAVGQVAVATFRNTQGLASNGKTTFTESATSGLAEIGKPDAGARGFIRPNALESANVDLTVELLALIEAQRSFQSIAQAIQNENEASDALLQLR